VLADSVADWGLSLVDDGVVTQGEFGWEYGYISNHAGAGGVFYGWHRSPYYWESNTGVLIYWPKGHVPPIQAWGQGGDSSGCRPPMAWSDGLYPWADVQTDHWAAARRWTSNYTGWIDIRGTIGRYFDPAQLVGWDVVFWIAVNADVLTDPALYSLAIPWQDGAQHDFHLPSIPVGAGDTVSFVVNASDWNANRSYMRLIATISEAQQWPGDLDRDLYITLSDLGSMAQHWQLPCTSPGWCDGADLTQDGVVDLNDLASLAWLWLDCFDPNPPCSYVQP